MRPTTFRNLDIFHWRGPWALVSRHPAERSWVWVNFTDPDHIVWRRTGRTVIQQYLPLLHQAFKVGMPVNLYPKIDGRSVLVPDWGISFLDRRLIVGWKDTLKDIDAFTEMLMSLWPLCLTYIGLDNCVIHPQLGIVTCPDMKTRCWVSIGHEFEIPLEYFFFVRHEIETSWWDFIQSYTTMVDKSERMIAQEEDRKPLSRPELIWDDIVPQGPKKS